MIVMILFYGGVVLVALFLLVLAFVKVAHLMVRNLNALMGEVAAFRLYLPHRPKTPPSPLPPKMPYPASYDEEW